MKRIKKNELCVLASRVVITICNNDKLTYKNSAHLLMLRPHLINVCDSGSLRWNSNPFIIIAIITFCSIFHLRSPNAAIS